MGIWQVVKSIFFICSWEIVGIQGLGCLVYSRSKVLGIRLGSGQGIRLVKFFRSELKCEGSCFGLGFM